VVESAGVPRIRLSPDYEAFPLWPDSPSTRRLRLPEDLHLSSALISDLQAWAEVHDSARTYRTDYEWDESVELQATWIERGHDLAVRLRRELGSSYVVNLP
jgi:hypothetical protein